jgi:anhydro-N-acetylmuramic acid kinase
MPERYIGIMSGTSLDGADAVLVEFDVPHTRVVAHCSAPMPQALREELLALNTPADNELHRAALAANDLVQMYADLVHRLLAQCQLRPEDVRAIGVHGQTVRHRPQSFGGTGYTLQLNNPALLAELCGMAVVADFRSRDVAAGGQGAPLVPPFHQAFFGQAERTIAVLNIGGISNLTVLASDVRQPLVGFDCGPGNALLDYWCMTHTGRVLDEGGAWGATGQVYLPLLKRLLGEPFFALTPPKSTGRDLFNADWLKAQLDGFEAVSPVDVQATLTELTAQTCANSLLTATSHCVRLFICGGGAYNHYLMARIQAALPGCQVESSETAGLPPLQVEATAFAWLARQTVHGNTSSVPSVTGAKGARILGAITPA